ncbi:MAG: 60S ribosomal export protein NMD3 [Promethearchaeota archaeon]
MKAPCYQCGNPAVIDGLCANCYDESHPLIEISSPLTLVACKRCGSVKVPSGWKKLTVDVTESDDLWPLQLNILLDSEIKAHGQDIELTIEEEKRLDRILNVLLTVNGRSHETLPPHEEQHRVEVRFTYGTCDTCAMMSGGYYEAILQVRADERSLTDEEEEDIVRLVTEMTIAEYGTDEKAFVTNVSSDKFGLDFQIGSEHLCRAIAKELESRYLAQRKDNYKLVGQDKGGKDKFRITILIRLNKFMIGDFVKVLDRPCQVISMSKGGLTCFDLIQRESFTMNTKSSKWRSLEYLAPKTESREFMVTTRVHGKPVQLMDSENYNIREVDETLLDPSIEVGLTVHGLLLEDEFYLLPN